MKTVSKIDALPQLQKRLRVAAYARVSSGKDAMLHSLASQISYYNQLISEHEGWEFAGVYADEALTGTKDTREEFQRLLADCKAGKIDLILVKAISRFARNTATLLETIRELKSINVDVFFEEQNLHSISPEGEMVLTFMASFAQEEARSVSENMKWRIKQDFTEGVLWGGRNCYGYRIVDRHFIIVPEEANLVRRIYDMYIGGMGDERIAKTLTKEGVPTFYGSAWRESSIRGILVNYNYTGDLLLQKTFRENYLTKRKMQNRGEFQSYIVEDDHEPIISKETFNQAVTIRLERRKHFLEYCPPKNIYPLTGLIKCGICGAHYRRTKRWQQCKWMCATFNHAGKSYCNSKAIPEETIYSLLKNELGMDKITFDTVKAKIHFIEAFNGNRLVFHLTDGTEKEIHWKDKSRRESWTPEMKELARKKALEHIADAHKKEEM
jgi:DNA invertase Pin-like site-specific DNA recombinase